jgi:16S rRNA (guanine527-N7)-methyltransferase
MLDLFEAQLGAWGFSLDPSAVEALRRFAERLSTYDGANVVGPASAERILTEHVLDSLSCLHFDGFRDARTLIDVGSGGGLPGIPLKLVKDGLAVSLVEATGKKARFLEQVVRELDLVGVKVLNQRAEEAARDRRYRGGYDVATARAVAPLDVLIEYCVPFLRVGGSMVAMKGRPENAEISAGERAAALVGAEIADLLLVPWLQEAGIRERRLIIVRKLRETPQKYPRRVGLPRKRPLGCER